MAPGRTAGTSVSESYTPLPSVRRAPEIDLINLCSSDDEPEAFQPPSKRPRLEAQPLSSRSRLSQAACGASHATAARSTACADDLGTADDTAASPSRTLQHDQTGAGLSDTPQHPPQPDPATFLGLTSRQIQELQLGDTLWWFSGPNNLQLACCSKPCDAHEGSGCLASGHSDSTSESVPIRVIWDYSGKCQGLHKVGSHQVAPHHQLQRHFFPGQEVTCRLDGLLQQGEVVGHMQSSSGMEFMVDLSGPDNLCPFIPASDLRAIPSIGQSSACSVPDVILPQTSMSDGLGAYEFIPSSPIKDSPKPDIATCAQSSDRRSVSSSGCPEAAMEGAGTAGSPAPQAWRRLSKRPANPAVPNAPAHQTAAPDGDQIENTSSGPAKGMQGDLPSACHAAAHEDCGETEGSPASCPDPEAKHPYTVAASATADRSHARAHGLQPGPSGSPWALRDLRKPLASQQSPQEDSDDADLLMDLSWLNARVRITQ